MTGLNKKLVVGVIVGVLVTIGTQWGMEKYQVMQAEQRLAAFHQGYSTATNKKAFMDKFFSMKSSVAVSLSTSKADVMGAEGDTDMEICWNMLYWMADMPMISKTGDGPWLNPDGTPASQDLIDTLAYYRSLNCNAVIEGTYKGRGPGEIHN